MLPRVRVRPVKLLALAVLSARGPCLLALRLPLRRDPVLSSSGLDLSTSICLHIFCVLFGRSGIEINQALSQARNGLYYG
jgi:hypothetical protein